MGQGATSTWRWEVCGGSWVQRSLGNRQGRPQGMAREGQEHRAAGWRPREKALVTGAAGKVGQSRHLRKSSCQTTRGTKRRLECKRS